MKQNPTDLKCDNYHYCGEWVPDWWKDCKGCWVCTPCDVFFGKENHSLVFSTEPIDCPDCRLQTVDNVAHPLCTAEGGRHVFCLDCFTGQQRGCDIDQPDFPYPHLEEEYNDSSEDPKWERDYPRIAHWSHIVDGVIELKESQCGLDKSCPVCTAENAAAAARRRAEEKAAAAARRRAEEKAAAAARRRAEEKAAAARRLAAEKAHAARSPAEIAAARRAYAESAPRTPAPAPARAEATKIEPKRRRVL